MKTKILSLGAIMILFLSCSSDKKAVRNTETGRFSMEKDLLLVQYDCKTDVDDLHSVAAFATLISDPAFSSVKYHAVAGTYGIQEGLYVPPNDLFRLTFGAQWTDAHERMDTAVEEVLPIVTATLAAQGDIWIAEAGQSDFSARLVKAVQNELPEVNTAQRIHVVQHSDWNENVTSPESLLFIKQNTDYQKIPDGNAVNNGTPGFRSPDYTAWYKKVRDPELTGIWQLAITLGNTYNGADGRYNNEAIAAGGLDFSDLSEVCWILGIEDIKDTEHFFDRFSR